MLLESVMVPATCIATTVEKRRPLPVDSLIPAPIFTSTHAITTDAPPERVWPWIAQMSAGRAGWYSWGAIDNGGAPSRSRIVPELQYVAPGDLMPAVPGARDASHRIMEARHLRGIQRRSTAASAQRSRVTGEPWRKALLVCGVASSLLYAVMIWGIRYEGYSLLAIGFGATAFGRRFRLYSIVTIVVLLVFGGLTFLEAPRLQMNLPTPWIGLWERINISVFLLWIVMLAAVLWTTQGQDPEGESRDAAVGGPS